MNKRKLKTLSFLFRRFSYSGFCFILLIAFLGGCTAFLERESPPEQAYSGQIDIFLKGPERPALDITFDLSAVSIISEDGTLHEVMSSPVSINSITAAGRQILLAEQSLPEGGYKRLRLIVRRAYVVKEGRRIDLSLPPEGVEADIDIRIRRNRNTSLFLVWNADASVVGGRVFRPVFSVKGRVPELSSLLIYVTNEGSDNVSVINRESAEVVATVMVGRRPRGVAAGLIKERMRVYVANSGSNSISVIDAATNKVEDEIPVRLGWEPVDIAVSRVAPGKELLFVTNYRSNSLSVIDSSSVHETDNINTGDGPVAVAVDPPVESLFGTGFLSTADIDLLRSYRKRFLNVYVANEKSNDVSVFRMDILNNSIEELARLRVGWGPDAIAVDYPRGKVYVANYDSDSLSVIDILQVIRDGGSDAVSTINNVGTAVTGVIADPDFERIYLLRKVPGEITIIRPFKRGFNLPEATMVPVTGIIPVGDSPVSFILGPEARKLYVVNRGSNNISRWSTRPPERKNRLYLWAGNPMT
ncbi:MAG: hypothetical protein GXP46_10445 [Deferribacteres bacterium]|nr:hypothetical protein [Deferribacteres bacterium]